MAKKVKFELSGDEPAQAAVKNKNAKSQSVFDLGWEKAAKTIPPDTLKKGPQFVLLWRQGKYGTVIPIDTLEIDLDQPIREQVEEWGSGNGFDVVDFREHVNSNQAAIATIRKKDEPWAACAALRD